MIRTRMTLIGAVKELKYGAWIRDVEAIAPWLTWRAEGEAGCLVSGWVWLVSVLCLGCSEVE